jgi:tetratricopeptide (TPR) repeat protein
MRGNLDEGVRLLEPLLRADDEPTLARAYALIGAADMSGDLGDRERSAAWAEEARRLCRAIGDRWGEAYTLLMLGFPHAERNEWIQARDRFAESAELFTKIGDRHLALSAERRLAWAYAELGDLDRAHALRRDNLRTAREIGDTHTEAQSLAWLADYAIDEGRVEDAAAHLAEAHEIHRGRRDMADRYWDAIILCRIARGICAEGDAATAVRLVACSREIFEEINAREEPWLEKRNAATLAAIRTRIDDATFDEAWEQGRRLGIDEAVELGLRSLRR